MNLGMTDAEEAFSDGENLGYAEGYRAGIAAAKEWLTLEERENIWYCDQCDRWQDKRVGCEADIREDERQKIATALEAENPKTAGLGGESGEAFARAVLKDFATRLRAGEIQ